MDLSTVSNLTDPAILFFFLGLLAGAVRSNLEIPAPVAKFLSLYLLVAIGFKGGQALAATGVTGAAVRVVALGVALALVIPAIGFVVLRRRVNAFDAAAVAATYGSVSAVTFIAGSQFLVARGDAPGGYLTVALVLMESPAIIMAVLLASWARSRQRAAETATGPSLAVVHGEPQPAPLSGTAVPHAPVATAAPPAPPLSMRAILHEALTGGPHMVLIGSLVIGAVSGPAGGAAMTPFVDHVFTGLLAFFLLEMGLLVARQLRETRDVGPFLVGFALGMPLVGAALALTLGSAVGLGVGDLTLLAVLAASGSYIVVPAVVRYAIPEARPSRYLTMALAITFPFNIVIGIPLYHAAAQALVG